MLNDDKSILVSKISVILFMALLLGCAAMAPALVSRLLGLSALAKAAGQGPFLATLYIGTIPAAALLISLFLLLQRIGRGNVFVRENVKCLCFISWCFFVGGLVCLLSSLYYAPWLPIGIMAVFMGIVVRVIKNVIAKAVALQDDADFTI